MQVKAVVFDAVGTVMYPQPSVAAVYQQAIHRHFGINLSENEIGQVFQSELSGRTNAADLSTSEAAEHDFWATVIRKLCPSDKGFESCFQDLFEHFGRGDSWRCFDDVAETMTAPKESGVKVAIASNFDQRLHPVCDSLPELSDINTRIISSVVGWRKPSPHFFAAVTEVLNLAPSEILMVGDDPENDVHGAINYGMEAVLISRSSSAPNVPERAHVLKSLTEIPQLINLESDGIRREFA